MTMITDIRNIQVHENGKLSNEDYHSHEFISGTGLVTIENECPAVLKYGEQKESPALHFGIASHAAMLEPELFDKEFARDIKKEDWDREEKDENGEIIITNPLLTNVGAVKSAMKAAGVIMTMADAKSTLKSIGALCSATEVKKAVTAAGVKVKGDDGKASSKSDDIVKAFIDAGLEGIIFMPPDGATLQDVAEDIIKVLPDAKIYCGPDDAESIYEGASKLLPDLPIFPVMQSEHAKLHEGKTLVPADDYDNIMQMRKTVFANNRYANMLKDCYVETSIICEIKVEGCDDWIGVKIRPDIITKNCEVPDYKTSRDIKPEPFGKQAYYAGYLLKQAFVCDVLQAVYGSEFKPGLLAQAKASPFIPQLYWLTEKQYNIGRMQYAHALQYWNYCKSNDVWPAYSDDAMDLEVPVHVENKYFPQ